MLKSMKEKSIFNAVLRTAGITVLVAAIVFTMIACGDGGDGGGGTDSVTYTGTKDGTTYTLKITGPARALTPDKGDDYKLTVVTGSVTKTSTGKVQGVSGNELTLAPSKAESEDDTFKVGTNGKNGLVNIIGLITFDDGEKEPIEIDLTPPVTPGGNDSVGIEMVKISKGTFQMGSPTTESGRSTGEHLHTVTLTSGFRMGKYEVTQEQWITVMGSNPSYFDGSSGKEPAPGEVQSKRPVENINWYEALAFCNKLSIMEGLTPLYKINNSTDPADWGKVPTSFNTTWDNVKKVSGSNGYRLPTEAQWEYACRAGTTGPYNFNVAAGALCWYKGNSDSKTHEVGKYPPNAWGLYDMHGNVAEFVWDWYYDYTESPVTDPTGDDTSGNPVGQQRLTRGGHYNRDDIDVRSAFRFKQSPYYKGSVGGIRVVLPE